MMAPPHRHLHLLAAGPLLAVGATVGLAWPLPAIAAQASIESSGLDALEAASRRDPGRHDLHLQLLEARLTAGDVSRAEALLDRLQPELRTDDRFALDVIYCLVRHDRIAQARAQWDQVGERIQASLRSASSRTLSPAEDAALRRRVAEGLFVQGLLTAHLGRKEEALGFLRQADGYGFPPLDSPLMALAADTLFELQEYTLAAQAYQEVLKRAPRSIEARLRLGISLYSAGRFAESDGELAQVLRRQPGLRLANYYRGAVLFELKRYDEAVTHLKRELALDARCAACQAKLAYIAYLNGDDRQCESLLAQATALDPTQPEANLVAGMLQIRTGRYEEAVRHLSRVVEQAPGYATAQYQLALAYQRSGNAEKAREHLEAYDRLIQEQKARAIGVRGAQ